MTTCFWSSIDAQPFKPRSNNELIANQMAKAPGRKITGYRSTEPNPMFVHGQRHFQQQHSGYNPPSGRFQTETVERGLFRRDSNFAPSLRSALPSIDGNCQRWNGNQPVVNTFIPKPKVKAPDFNRLVRRCYVQAKLLEMNRSKMEKKLTSQFPEKRISSSNNYPKLRAENEMTQADLLVVINMCEHARVTTLVSGMDLYHPVHPGVYSTLQSWLDGTRKLEMVRKQEVLDQCPSLAPGLGLVSNGQMLLALEELCSKTRAARTALWCAFITFISNEGQNMTLPKVALKEQEPVLLSLLSAPAAAPGLAAPPAPVAPPARVPALRSKTGRPLVQFVRPSATPAQ